MIGIASSLFDWNTNWIRMFKIIIIVERSMNLFVLYVNASPSTPLGSYVGISFTNFVNLGSRGSFVEADTNIFGFFTLISILSLYLPFETSNGKLKLVKISIWFSVHSVILR